MLSNLQHIPLSLRRFLRREDGSALIEFAILIPIMLVTFALIVEGGRMFWSYQNAITGVRDTARYIGRIAPSDMCQASPSATIGDYQALATTRLAALSKSGITVSMDSLTLECVGTTGQYRVSPTPIAVLTASVTILDAPFTGLFQLVNGTTYTTIDSSVTDRSRIFGP